MTSNYDFNQHQQISSSSPSFPNSNQIPNYGQNQLNLNNGSNDDQILIDNDFFGQLNNIASQQTTTQSTQTTQTR